MSLSLLNRINVRLLSLLSRLKFFNFYIISKYKRAIIILYFDFCKENKKKKKSIES